MGCCVSTTRSSPYPSTSPTAQNSPDHPAPTSSRAHIVGPQQQQLPPLSIAPSTSAAASPRNSSQQREQVRRSPAAGVAASPGSSPLAATPNTPLKALPPSMKIHTPDRRPWTRKRLKRERETFWETRVTNSPEIWGLLCMVSELVSQGQIAEAQSVLDAGGCTCPTGDVWIDDSSSIPGNRNSRRRRKGLAGVYDELGRCYEVPGWVVGTPVEVHDTEDSVEAAEDGNAISEEEDEELMQEKTGAAESKGKGRAVDMGETVKVRARLSDRGTDVLVKVGEMEPIRGLVGRIREYTGVPPATKIRIAYLGKILHEHDSLKAQGWREGHVVNVMVFQQSPPAASPGH